MHDKKGQAAMEFLMTYGWAILAVLVAIGALAYFGVLSPSKNVPNYALAEPGFFVDDFKVTSSKLEFILGNSRGFDIEVAEITFTNLPSGASCNDILLSSPVRIKDGGSYSFSTSCSGLNEGDIFSAKVVVSYTKVSSVIGRSFVIDVNSEVEPGSSGGTTCTPDGCNGICPSGCSAADDPDCSGTGCCGDGSCDSGETCLCSDCEGKQAGCSSGELCCSGICKAIVCSADSDCNDGNPCHTNFACNNPGTCSASCSYYTLPDCCGNGICDGKETSYTCPEDCGAIEG